MTYRRCGCCKRQPTCPFEQIEGIVLRNPSPEHCAVTVVDGMVHKYIKPAGNMQLWRERQRIAAEHPDLFVPFELVGRVVVQELVHGEHDRETAIRVVDEIIRRGIKVLDVAPTNLVGDRFVDFQVLYGSRRVRQPRSKTGQVGELPRGASD